MTKTSVAIWLHSPSSESTWFSILVWLDGAGIIGRVGLGMKFRMEVRFCKNQLTYEKAIMNSPDSGVHECQSRIPKNTACIETTVFATWRASPGFAKSKPQKMVSFRTGDVSANVADQACLRPRVSQFSLVPTGGWQVSLFGVDLGILIHRPFCNVWFASWGGRAGFATCAFTVRHGGMSPFSRQHSAPGVSKVV